jgi:GTP-binding protein
MEEIDHKPGERLFRSHCDFATGASSVESLPLLGGLPEVAFVGRSNVGKSSLINALTFRKSLARTSSSPGHTRQLNFFNLGDLFILVDLPGYGHAEAAKHEIKGWTRLMHDYLRGRRELKRVCLLVDSRHDIKPNDEEMMTLLDDSAVPYQIVLTKIDKAKSADLVIEKAREIAKKHPAALAEPMAVSSLTGAGMPELRTSLACAMEN